MNNDVVKKTVYDKLVTKVNTINSSKFVLKTQYDTDKLDLEKKSMTLTKKYLVLVVLLKNLIIMQKLVKSKAKYLVFLV